MLKTKPIWNHSYHMKISDNDLTSYNSYFDLNTSILPYTTTNTPLSTSITFPLHMNISSQPTYSPTHTIPNNSFGNSQDQLIYSYPSFPNILEL